MNDAAHEVLIRGMSSALKIDESPFRKLFKAFGADPKKFLGVAWILAVCDLKQSGSIEAIDEFSLTLAGTTLRVTLVGRRHRRYTNVDPYEIRVQGELEL